MHFLRTLGWIALTVVVVVFSLRNWDSVTINLFGGLQADVKLPVLLAIAFLLGFVPLYVVYRARLWSARKKIATTAAPSVQPAVPSAAAPATDPSPSLGELS